MAKNKPVFEVNTETMWDYEYQAKIHIGKTHQSMMVLASNSLINLKKEIRERKYRLAWITTRTGNLSYGQSVVDEYPYKPKLYR